MAYLRFFSFNDFAALLHRPLMLVTAARHGKRRLCGPALFQG